MTLSEDQVTEIESARKVIDILVESGTEAEHLLVGFKLPDRILALVKVGLGFEDRRRRAISLLPAMEWLSVDDPVPAIGASLALQAFWGRTLEEQPLEENARLARSNLSLTLKNLSYALIGAGAFEDVRIVAQDLIPDLEAHQLPLTALALRVAEAQAALRLGRTDEARALLPSADIIRIAASAQMESSASAILESVLVERDNLALELDRLQGGSVAESESYEDRQSRVLEETIDAVRVLLQRTGGSASDVAAASEKLAALRPLPGASLPDKLAQAARLARVLEEILLPLAPGLRPITAVLATAAEALASDDPDVLDAAVAALDEDQETALKAQDIDSWLSNAWLTSLIHERRGRSAEALDVLEELLIRREALARLPATAMERAGFLSAYPDLPVRLAKLRRSIRGDVAGMFGAIEGGKGRWLADRGQNSSADLSRFRAASAAAEAHYLTFCVGSEVTVAVFVPFRGAPSATEIPIGRAEIARVGRSMVADARVGGAKFQAALAFNLADRLGALTAWLPEPTANGPLRLGDVLVVAPHGPLHTIPIHALPARDGIALAPRVAVVRVHSAAHASGLFQRAAINPTSALAVCALAANEKRPLEREASFRSVVDELERHMACQVLNGDMADFDTLHRSLGSAQAVHLFAHGDANTGAPFTRSGILLAHEGRPPIRGEDAFSTPHLVSPARIVQASPSKELGGSHFTLQACVSGHAESNVSGDAIGLEWSLLLSGAASVLATHWHIDFETSARFCRMFYKGWLGEGLCRAEAFRRSAVMLQGEAGSGWAAFSLTGDWR